MENVKNKNPENPFDIDGQKFNPDLYLQRLLKESSLKDIMDREERIVSDTQKLHSEMQTLVYENYNKFISATDTIKKMKSDFKKMETEMDLLATNMNSITSFSDQISGTLHDTRQQISKLSGIHSLLKRLQFLFKLPNKLKTLMEEGNYSQAVQDYLHTQQVLNHYAHLESFQGIQADCVQIVQELKEKLRAQFKSKETTAKELTQSVELLLLLGEPAENLYEEILTHASNRLSDHIIVLSSESAGQDLIEFVDLINNGFLSDLCLVVTSYNDLFVNLQQNDEENDMRKGSERLNNFVEDRMSELMLCFNRRVEIEQEKCDIAVLVRALDRFYSSINTLASLFNQPSFSKRAIEVLIERGEVQCGMQLTLIKSHLDEMVRTVRQNLAQPQHENTAELLASLVLTTVEKLKSGLHDLTTFVQPELSFASNKEFLEAFSVKCVRQGLVINFLDHIVELSTSFTTATSPSLPTLLVLAKMCLEFQTVHVSYILNLVDEWFTVKENKGFNKEKQEICDKMHAAAQELVNHYVRMEGNTISQMLRKSVETRDWVHSLEPWTVRAVMKRVLEEIALVETQVGSLFEEGTRTERSSDSSRRTASRHHRSNWSSYAGHIHKLFSERIQIFAPVQFSKVSILTGIIKISLKTLLECVRLKTFSTFGLQQIQVDTHYLQLYLWRYVADENLVHLLLDEILGSAVHRCMKPALMLPSVVEKICERG